MTMTMMMLMMMLIVDVDDHDNNNIADIYGIDDDHGDGGDEMNFGKYIWTMDILKHKQ